MNVGVLGLTFLSVNLDFFFMLIFLLKKYRLMQVMLGYLLGNLILLSLSYLIGRTLLLFLPEWVLGILGLLPIYLALHDDDDAVGKKQHRAPVWAVLVTYLSVCAGCNLSIFLPVLVGETVPNFLVTLVLIGGMTLLVVLVIKLISEAPLVTQVMTKYGEKLMKVCYIAIGCYVFWDSGLIRHLIALI